MPTKWVKSPSLVNACGPCPATNYNNYHAVSGTVQMRLNDISLKSGSQWQYANLAIEMIDSHGTVRASRTLSKSWGVTPGWTTMFAAGAGASVRLRIAPNVGPAGCCDEMSFIGELKWG